eukprot:gene1985-11449_t
MPYDSYGTLRHAKIASAVDGTMKTQVDLGNNFFCQAKVSGKELTEKVAVVKANIRMVLEGLRELQNLDSFEDGSDGGGGTFFDPGGGRGRAGF